MAAMYGNTQTGSNSGNPPRLLDRLTQALRTKHYSYRTQQAYVYSARRFILFHDKLKEPYAVRLWANRAFCEQTQKKSYDDDPIAVFAINTGASLPNWRPTSLLGCP